ncbi:ABC transporter permease [Blastopirellula marina]|uniref:ABC3 transporter permease C-terminal domain-containing protein n=1 Tax=Blastopirellula marina DSM 3645 TaxID=314230 RepID=A3ZPC9_9BACT|nr:ABC transporter permease [Blastopirellula marina]EAQ81607.1 hypothetical protein DSM3645_28537 [Blastopirellula marina DSM 3645]
MSRWILYHTLTFLDVLRLWPTVQHHIVIVAGICFPILLLLGLKNGHVADLRAELLKSASGRQIVFWSGQQGELLTVDGVRRMEEGDPRIEVVIPEIQRLASVSSIDAAGKKHWAESVTLYSTKPGDPILRQYGVDDARLGKLDVILLQGVAKTLQVKPGDSVTVTLTRAREGIFEEASLDLNVGAIVESNDAESSAVGYLDLETLSRMEQYVMGYQVPEFHWPAFRASAPDTYSSYLILCEKGGDLTEEDLRTLEERGYHVANVESEELRSLYGLLKPEALSELVMYQMAIEGGERNQSLDMAPGQLARMTQADDVFLPWNRPLEVEIEGVQQVMVGLSLPQRTWLRLYLQEKEAGFGFDSPTFSVQLFGGEADDALAHATFTEGANIPLAATRFVAPQPSEIPETPADPPEMTREKPPLIEPVETAKSAAVEAAAESMQPPNEVEAPPMPPTVDGESKSETSEAETTDVTDETTQPSPEAAAGEETSAEPNSDALSSAPTEAKKDGEEKEATDPAPVDRTEMETPANPQTPSPPEPEPVEPATPSVAIVPMDLLAHFHAAKAGRVEYDPNSQLFVALPSEPLFPKARLYAETIDDVPIVVEQLRNDGFAVMSEETRIREIHQQDHSLQLLVVIVGAGVFLFGTITVVSVLLDSTDRKRGTIGILRVMGVSRAGVFYMVFLRSAIIGVLAAAVTVGFGILMALLLEWSPPVDSWMYGWKPVVHLIIRPIDMGIIVVGALLCCMFGSLLPANRASRMDPFDAILEGRFR